MLPEVNDLFTSEQLETLINQAIQQGQMLTSIQVYEVIPGTEDDLELFLAVRDALTGRGVLVQDDNERSLAEGDDEEWLV